MLRILVISDLLPPRMIGGFELACLNLSRGLREHGHDVLVLTTSNDRPTAPEENADEWIDRSLNLRELFVNVESPSHAMRSLFEYESRVSNVNNSLIVLDRIRSFRPDHVMMFNLVGLGGLGILDTVRQSGVSWTLNLGDDVPRALLAPASAEARAIYDAGPGGLFESGQYAFVSETLREEVTRGASVGPSTVIPRGIIDVGLERTAGYRVGGTTRFVAASIAKHKGIDLVIEAAAALRERSLDNFRVDLYGGGDTDRVAAAIAANGLSDHLFLAGPVTQRELLRAHSESDAFVFPTWEREPGASAPSEAASVGAVPILTADCGPAEQLVDGIHALKIPRTSEALADAMARVISGEVDLEAMARAGRELTRGDLSFATSVRRLSDYLEAGTVPQGGELDVAGIAQRVISKDDAALRGLFAQFEEKPPVVEPVPPAEPVRRSPRVSRGPRGIVRTLGGRIIRPVIELEFRRYQDEVDARDLRVAEAAAAVAEAAAAVAAREAAIDAREKELTSLVNGVKKDILATNYRINWLESNRGTSAPE